MVASGSPILVVVGLLGFAIHCEDYAVIRLALHAEMGIQCMYLVFGGSVYMNWF